MEIVIVKMGQTKKVVVSIQIFIYDRAAQRVPRGRLSLEVFENQFKSTLTV